MAETVEVVASQAVMIPAGQMEPGDRFQTTKSHAAEMASLGVLEMVDGNEPDVDRAVAAGDKKRAEAEEAERVAAEKARIEAEKAERAEARAAKAAKD